ncbi:MAG: polysaccharide deacetylase family protein [Negativicutes bacterium]|nr:polysaccharide deacetylase family protein [Negativicutes bacterium]
MISRRQFLKVCAQAVVATSFAGSFFPGAAGFAAGRVPVLAYHRIGYNDGDLTVTPERLASDLGALAREGYQSITLDQFARYLKGDEANLPAQPMLLTFDDGYRDNYENAFPVLQRNGMTAAFFIITGMVDTPERITASQILEMAHYGMSFGSHTVSHRSLDELSGQEALQELTFSRQQLEDIVGRPVDFIAYPKGGFNNETIRIAKDTGYFGGLTVRYGTCSGDSPHYTLRRIPVFRPDPGVLAVISRRS